MTYWRRDSERKVSHTMDSRFRFYLTVLIVVVYNGLLSHIIVTANRTETSDISGWNGYGMGAQFNQSDYDLFMSSKRSLYPNITSRAYTYPGYDRSIYYAQYQSPAYNDYQRVMYGSYNYNYRQPLRNSNYRSYVSPGQVYNQTQLRSPYQNLPGTYQKSAYNSQLYFSGTHYNAEDIYGAYLATGAYLYHSGKCAVHYGQTPQISVQDMDSAFGYAHYQLQFYSQQYGNYSSYSPQTPPLQLKEKEALLMEYVTEYFAKYKCLSKYQTTTYLPSVTVGHQYLSHNRYGDTSCYSSYGGQGWTLQCPDWNSKYRSADGSCNNVKHPFWGKSYVCHIRLLPPDYADGVQEPRMALDGHPLPSSRTITNVITSDKPFDSYYTHFKVAFGQYVNHDITLTPVHGNYALTSKYNGAVDCCKNRNKRQCFPILIDPTPSDYQYSRYNNTCINFVRSAPCPLCEIGPRQQLNIATSFIDGSPIYGNTVNDSINLRTFRFGLLKTSKDMYGKPILLATPAPYQNECSPSRATMQCFTAGDQRVNQHPQLMSMHLVWVRRHNQHVTALRLVNPHWNDETLYQEGRRLVGAELQHITYKEYLPLVFGPLLMDYFNLNVANKGYTNYEPFTDPTSWTDFSTAACRAGHSQIQGLHSVYIGRRGRYNTSDSYLLKDRFMDPSYLWEGKIDGILTGLMKDMSGSVDPNYANDIKNYLLRKKGDLYGGDLVSTNIQRGRDHAIPGYVNYLKFCFGFEVRSWDDLKAFIPEHIVKLFRQLYKSWKDIDLYIAGVSERHFPDADIGPTFACVQGIQYYHLKFGDRYYYEHGGQSGSFTLAQLDNIRNTTTLARLVCRTGDYIVGAQPYAFFPESKFNKRISCKQYEEINYLLWKEV